MKSNIISALCAGWRAEFADDQVRASFTGTPRKVVISAHTAPFFDGIALHLGLEQLGVEHTVYVRGLGRLLCPAWCQEIGGRGFVGREVERLRALPAFCRALFPSGGRVSWKSGYHRIAKGTGAKVFVLGLDYGTRRVRVCSVIDPQITSLAESTERAVRELSGCRPGPFHVCLRVATGYGDMVFDAPLRTIRALRILAVFVLGGLVFIFRGSPHRALEGGLFGGWR